MKYTKEERLDIGRRIYNNEFTRHEAMEEFDITETTVDNYIRMYRTQNNLPPRSCQNNPLKSKAVLPEGKTGYDEFDSMTREELIGEIIKARINEARAFAQEPFEPRAFLFVCHCAASFLCFQHKHITEKVGSPERIGNITKSQQKLNIYSFCMK